MSQIFHSVVRMIALTAVMLIIFAGLLYVAGARINLTPSIPVGLYWITQKPIQKGEYVLFCPPQKPVFKEALLRGYINPGFCKGGYGQMMKKVFATTGDRVSITREGVWVNSRLLPLSTPLAKDIHGRILPHLNATIDSLKPTQLLLMTNQNALSFDGRYFGLVNLPQILEVIRPVLTWKSTFNFNE